MRNRIVGLVAGLAAVFSAAGAAQADPVEDTVRFCMQTEGREAAFIQAATAAGLTRAPQTFIPTELLAEDSNTVGYASRGPSGTIQDGDLIVVKTPKVHVPQNGLDLESSNCLVSVGVPTPGLRERLTARLGAGAVTPEGTPSWIYSVKDGVIREESGMIGNADAVRAAQSSRTIVIVMLFEDADAAAILVMISRPKSR